MDATSPREALSDRAVVDMTLADGRHPLTEDRDGGLNFNSAKLSINPVTPSPSQRMDNVEFRGGIAGGAGFSGGSEGGLRRDRPFSASVMSRRSTTSTKSRVSLSPHIVTTELAAISLFSYRTTAIEKAVEACKKSIVDRTIDGEVTGYWLLTEIDHWDMEKERLVILTTNSLLIVRYDFIALLARECKRVALKIIDYVELGDFYYPQYSFMPSREHGGFRIHWSKTIPSWAQRWNPWCSDIGYATLTHHMLAYHPNEKETATFDVGDFADSLNHATGLVRQAEGRTEPLTVQERPIIIESYASMTSMVFNQSHLGFNMERGGVSF